MNNVVLTAIAALLVAILGVLVVQNEREDSSLAGDTVETMNGATKH